MCVIGIYEKSFPRASDLIDMESMNPEGAGISWSDGKYVYWKKNVDAKEIIKMIKLGKVKLPLIVHFRISSVGESIPSLTHPFECTTKNDNKLEGKTTKPLLFHNGTWLEYKEHLLKSIQATGAKIPNGDLNDSRIMAYLVAKHGENYMSLLGEGQKVVLMKPDEIIKFGTWYDGKKEKAVLSNTYFQKTDMDYGYTASDLANLSQGKEPVKRKGLTQEQLKNWEKIKKASKARYGKNADPSSITGTNEFFGCDGSYSIENNPEYQQDSMLAHTGYKRPNKLSKTTKKKIAKIEAKICLNDTGISGLRESERQRLLTYFDDKLLSFAEAQAFEELVEVYPENEIILEYYDAGKDMQDVRLRFMGY